MATLLLVARFTGRREADGPSGFDALAPLLLAATPGFACWSTGGLESALFTCLVTASWTTYLLEKENGSGARRIPLSGVWMALAAMTRPEGVLLFALTGLFRLGEMVLVEKRLRPTRHDWLWGLGFAALFVPYFAWRWNYFGGPFPNSYYVRLGSETPWARGFRYFGAWFETQALWWLAALAAVARPAAEYRRFLALGGVFGAGLSLHVITVGGDFMALQRFFMPLMPILAIAAALGLRGLAKLAVARGTSRRGVEGVAILLAVILAVLVVRVDRESLRVDTRDGVDSIGWLHMFAEQCTLIGQWMAENVDPEGSLAVTAAGAIPYYSRLETLDLLGVNDEWIAHNAEHTDDRPGHGKQAPPEYFESRQITYFVGHPEPDFGETQPEPIPDYRWKTATIPGLRVNPNLASSPVERTTDATFGYWERQ